MMVQGRVALCRAVLASWVVAAFAAAFTGPVVSVLDGDIIEVLHNYTPDVSALAH